MRVKIGTYYLAGDPGTTERVHSSAAFTKGVGSVVTQTAKGWRWVDAAHYDRGNLDESIEFETRREFGTIALAMEWFYAFHLSLPLTGTVDFVIPTATGTTTYSLTGCVITPPSRPAEGVCQRLTYRVQGKPSGAGVPA